MINGDLLLSYTAMLVTALTGSSVKATGVGMNHANGFKHVLSHIKQLL